MAGGQTAVVSCIHRVQHVERFLPSHLADDDAVRRHTEGRLDQVLHADLTFALCVCVSRFEGDEVRYVPDLELGGVLDRDDTFIRRDILTKRI